jgi:hypothetical protein
LFFYTLSGDYTMTILPQDMFDRPIPALRLKPGAAQILSAGASSVRTTQFTDTTRVVSLYATVPVFVRFGGSTVTAASSDHYFPEGLYYDFAIGGDAAPVRMAPFIFRKRNNYFFLPKTVLKALSRS